MSLKEDIENIYNLCDAEGAYQLFMDGKMIISYHNDDDIEIKVFVFRETIFKYDTYRNYTYMGEDTNTVCEFFKGVDRTDFNIEDQTLRILNDIEKGKMWKNFSSWE